MTGRKDRKKLLVSEQEFHALLDGREDIVGEIRHNLTRWTKRFTKVFGEEDVQDIVSDALTHICDFGRGTHIATVNEVLVKTLERERMRARRRISRRTRYEEHFSSLVEFDDPVHHLEVCDFLRNFVRAIFPLMTKSFTQLSTRDQDILQFRYGILLDVAEAPGDVLEDFSDNTRRKAVRRARLRLNDHLRIRINASELTDDLREAALRFVDGGSLERLAEAMRSQV